MSIFDVILALVKCSNLLVVAAAGGPAGLEGQVMGRLVWLYGATKNGDRQGQETSKAARHIVAIRY